MTTTDLTFLFLFLPLSLAVCRGGVKLRKYILLMVSLLFYACGSPDHFLLLLFSLAITVLIGWLINLYREQKGLSMGFLIIGIAYNVGILFYYKYFDFIAVNINKLFSTDFTTRNLALPLGLSFFTFKAISYLVDTYKQEVKNSPVNVALYLSFFCTSAVRPIVQI